MSKIFQKLSSAPGLKTGQSSSREERWKVYRDQQCKLSYPGDWKTTNEKGILNFFPAEEFGAVTYSYRTGYDFPMTKTRELILEMNGITDDPQNVKMTRYDGVAEFYYEHIEGDVQWVTRVFRKNFDFFMLTINCSIDKWEGNKETFLKVMNSFQLY